MLNSVHGEILMLIFFSFVALVTVDAGMCLQPVLLSQQHSHACT